jgi:hypothetical protein
MIWEKESRAHSMRARFRESGASPKEENTAKGKICGDFSNVLFFIREK